MKNKSFVIWLIAICLLLVAAYTVYTKNKPLNISQSQNSSRKTMAPEFTLKDLDGNKVKLSDYRGKIVILNFWATWCGYCIQEMPDLNELNNLLKKGNDAVILAIDSKESVKTVRDYITSANIGLKVLMDMDGKVTDLYTPYGIKGFPTTFILNPDGSFYTYISGATNKETLMAIIEKIRKGEPLIK
ncbi:MAG: TlpA family protein disulfide reductase [Ruminiclostridium sp.]|nr:TlpA family protein disulfide reductase [Ruminiclostridium sp.]